MFCQETHSRVPLFTGPQPLTGSCFSTGFLLGHSIVWAHLPLLVWSPPQAADRYLLPMGLCQLKMNNLPHHGLQGSLLWHTEHLPPVLLH